ncbi:MAG TPA: CDP-alcohol phosphatidyltransferase family protein [Euryarchaeota archaeon]|nr:CDP-alcohol phosphatidyltransferase family protein [Euryarchaeota archaeon]
MVLERLRGVSDELFIKVSRPFLRFSPNTISVFAFLVAVIAGLLFSLDYITFGGILVLLNGFLDALDGCVARINNKSSKLGDLIDHTLDRIADVAMMLGLTFSSFLNDRIGFIGALVVLLVSYMGTQAQALGVGRVYAGIIGRADRVLLLGVFSIVQGVLGHRAIIYDLTIIDLLIVYFIVAGIVTVIQRFRIAYKALLNEERKKDQTK